MSNALLSTLPPALLATADSLRAAAAPEKVLYGMQFLMAAGLLVIAVLAVMTWANPKKLRLDRVPGRPNQLSPLLILPVFLVFMLASSGAARLRPEQVGLFGKLTQPQVALLAGMVVQLLMLGMFLVIAEKCFSLGAVYGMGLRLGHWKYGTLQALAAYLAVFPVCYGLQKFVQWVLQSVGHADWIQEHPMLVQLRLMTPFWQGVIVISTVVLAPLVEEIFFRGLVQSMIKHQTRRPWLAIMATSAIFAVLHPVRDMLAIFAFSVLLGYLYERSGKLYVSIATHVLFNAMSISFVLAAG